MSAWSHLPNAKHIDCIIESLKSRPEIWRASCNETRNITHNAVWDAARSTAWITASTAARDTIWNTACVVAYRAANVSVLNSDWDAAWNAARDAIIALVAYDDCKKYLTMPSEQLKTWAFLSEDPAAILLIPAVITYEQIRELETT
jgi:hypothetical protein